MAKPSSSAPARRTNLVLVVFDTLRRDAVGAYGQRPPWGADFPAIETPHLDRFAAQSVRFDRAFPEVLPTLPARRSLYTGQRLFPFTEPTPSLKGDFIGAPGWGPIPEHQHTLAEILSGAGYRTGLVSDLYHQFKPSKNFARGFDQWTFIRGQEADPARSGPAPSREFTERFIPRELIELRARRDAAAGIDRPAVPEWAANLVRNFYGRETETDWTSAQVFTEAVQWIGENADARQSGEGFFLTVECFDPHEPWFTPPAYSRRYHTGTGQDNVMSPYAELEMDPNLLRRTRANYAGLVTMVDHWFGALMARLERDGLLEDTAVAVLADHGHSLLERGYMGKRPYPAVPEVFAVPMMLRLPGGRHAGRAEQGWIQHHDLTATLLDLARVDPPQPLDGRSVMPVLDAGAPQVRDHVVAAWGAGLVVVTEQWWLAVKADGHGAVLYPRETATDPAQPNVADRHPAVVKQLFELALDEAGGAFPVHLIEAAARAEDAPGCSPVAAVELAGDA